jgi:hypothetical protein
MYAYAATDMLEFLKVGADRYPHIIDSSPLAIITVFRIPFLLMRSRFTGDLDREKHLDPIPYLFPIMLLMPVSDKANISLRTHRSPISPLTRSTSW